MRVCADEARACHLRYLGNPTHPWQSSTYVLTEQELHELPRLHRMCRLAEIPIPHEATVIPCFPLYPFSTGSAETEYFSLGPP